MKPSPSGMKHTYGNRWSLLRWALFIMGTILAFGGLILLAGLPYLLLTEEGFQIPEDAALIFTLVTLAYPVILWGILSLIPETKNYFQKGRNPDGLSLTDEGIVYDHYDLEKEKYIHEEIPWACIQKCVVSEKGNVIFRQKSLGTTQKRFETLYYYTPSIHLIYEKNQEKKHYTIYAQDQIVADDILTKLQEHNIPLKITYYDLTHVPESKLIEVLEDEEFIFGDLTYKGDIKELIDSSELTHREPHYYRAPYIESLIEERGLVKTAYPYWWIYGGQATLFFLVSLGAGGHLYAPDSVLFTMVVPYVPIAVGYVAFLYRLKQPRYWKTLIHYALSLLALKSAEAVSSLFRVDHSLIVYDQIYWTLFGFFLGSFTIYVAVKEHLREYWPAVFHHEIAKWLKKNSGHPMEKGNL